MQDSRRFVVLALSCLLCFEVASAADRGPAPSAAVPNPWSLRATLSAPGSPLEFGFSVAVGGNTIVTTANTAVDVYVKPAAGWASLATPTAKLTASDGSVFTSVAINGNIIVAGSIQADGTGAAYLFVEPASGWKSKTETAKLTASDALQGDFVGTSVSISGNTVVVGADENNSVGIRFGEPNGGGAAYVFVKPASGWANMTETAKLTASDGVAGDDFGYSVVVQGDTIAVGAPNAVINSTTLEGAVYVFQKSGTEWANATQTAKLTASDGHEVTVMGIGLSMNGSVIAAAAFDKVYIFVKPSTGWASNTQVAELSSTAYTFFGLNSVAIYKNKILAGSPYENQPFADLYVEPSGEWTNMRPSYRLKAPAHNGNGSDGYSVAMNATTLVVGSPLLGGSGRECGLRLRPEVRSGEKLLRRFDNASLESCVTIHRCTSLRRSVNGKICRWPDRRTGNHPTRCLCIFFDRNGARSDECIADALRKNVRSHGAACQHGKSRIANTAHCRRRIGLSRRSGNL